VKPRKSGSSRTCATREKRLVCDVNFYDDGTARTSNCRPAKGKSAMDVVLHRGFCRLAIHSRWYLRLSATFL
jgi:hypothetical protein